MRYFRIISNDCFYTMPGQNKGVFGFYATFHVASESAIDAVHDVASLLMSQVAEYGLKKNSDFIFSSFCYVSDIWEISEGEYREHLGKRSGFVFYKINIFSALSLLAKRIYLLVMNRNKLINHRLG